MSLIIALLFFLVATFQAVVVPPGAGPDDDFHLASIYCASGKSDSCKTSESYPLDSGWALVPSQLIQFRCYAGDISKSSSCAYENTGPGLAESRVNGLASDVGFYRVQHLSINDLDPVASVIQMRIQSAVLISSGLFGLLLFSKNRRRKSEIGLVFLLISLPFGFNLFGTNNPSLWTLYGIPLLWFSMSNPSPERTKRFGSLIIAVAASLMILESRPDGKIFLPLTLLIILMNSKLKLQIKLATFGSLMIGLLLLKPLYSGLVSSGTIYVQEATDKTNWLHNAFELPSFLLGVLGGRGEHNTLGFGVYDLPMPSLVSVSILIALLLLTSKAFSLMSYREKLVVSSVVLLVPASALYGLNSYATWPGGLFQPRYLLPVFALAILQIFSYPSYKSADSNYDNRFAAVLLSIAYIVFTFVTVKRYSNGIQVADDSYLSMYFGSRDYIGKKRLVWDAISGSNNYLMNIPSSFVFLYGAIVGVSLITVVTWYFRKQLIFTHSIASATQSTA
jgi:hypothetical protein